MKVLAIVKRVEDPEIKIKIKGDGSDIETDQMKYVVNPFDEIAVEEAIRLRDTHSGELAIACVGSKEATQQIRTALAMGADRGIHVAVVRHALVALRDASQCTRDLLGAAAARAGDAGRCQLAVAGGQRRRAGRRRLVGWRDFRGCRRRIRQGVSPSWSQRADV